MIEERVLVVSAGEPGGIGVDLLLAIHAARHALAPPPFYLRADPEFVAARARTLKLDVVIKVAAPLEAGELFATALPVAPLGRRMANNPGRLDPADGPAVIEAIRLAVADIAAGSAAALVTAPIHKANLYAGGFKFPGHTEYLGDLAGRMWPGAAAEPVMMLAGPDLRTVPVTVHIALADVPEQLTTERIVAVGRIVAADLTRRFGLARPRLAIAGLNPHAGEDGAMGTEDATIIAPAIAMLRAEGIEVSGPWPADTLFHAEARASYDAVLAMYHDQALIPVKTIAFDETVNVTLGLPFIRTSPDHGTALNLAGTGHARPASMLAALRLAAKMVARHG